jgi:hypothetical protein
VERHRGRLEIVSRQGEGTNVSFTLPVQALPRVDLGEQEPDGGAAGLRPSQNRNAAVT